MNPSKLELENISLREELALRRDIGRMLSNIVYNTCQGSSSTPLTLEERKTCFKLAKKWDAIKRTK